VPGADGAAADAVLAAALGGAAVDEPVLGEAIPLLQAVTATKLNAIAVRARPLRSTRKDFQP